MSNDEIDARLETALSAELDVDSPDALYNQAALIESFSYIAVKRQAAAELKLAGLEKQLRDHGPDILLLKGTAGDRKMQWEAQNSDLMLAISKAESEVQFWKGIGRSIEKKVTLVQSVLSNMTSSIKAGIRS